MVPFLQNCLINFCNLFSVNLENVPMKDSLKYWIFSLSLTWFYFTKFVHDLFISIFVNWFVN